MKVRTERMEEKNETKSRRGMKRGLMEWEEGKNEEYKKKERK